MNKDWLDISVLEDYLDGKLDAKTMNRVEREALDDPFVAEALAGLSESPKRALQSISLLQKQLRERIAEQDHVKKTSVITWQRLSIAATAAVLFVSISIMFWMRENNHQRELAGRAKKVDVTIAPAVEPPAVQAAPVIANEPSADQIREEVIDKAVEAAKINTYAARIKTKKEAAAVPAVSRQLDEVVVTGFSAQRKQQVTASAVTMSAPESQNVLSGKVVAKDDGKPLPGVSVRITGTLLTAVTDVNGEFKIKADTVKEGKLRVNSIGFKTAELLAKANQPVNVTLAPDNSALNEVVVTSYGKAKKERNTDSVKLTDLAADRTAGIRIRGVGTLSNKKALISSPVEGWDKLWVYLEENNTFRNEQKTGLVVKVSFKIDKEGRPVDIKIENEEHHKYEQEAIRLLMNGPKWNIPAQRQRRMTFAIDF